MSAFCWFLAAWYMLGVTLTVTSVGKPRRPVTSGQAACSVLINVAFAVGLALVATRVLA